jgi:hypothetical protein
MAMTERLAKKWTLPIYAFVHPQLLIQIIKGHQCHIFACAGKTCQYACCWFLDTGDANLTGNLRKHIKACWGEEALAAADSAASVEVAQESIFKGLNTSGSITMLFEQKGKGQVTYSNQQHMQAETQTELVWWVCKSLQPFQIVSDRSFQCLMKTRCLHYYLPSPLTISQDIKSVFAQTRKQIAKLLQVCSL